MSQDNERRARELLTTIGASCKMDTEAIALLRAAIDEAEARGAVKWRPVRERPERPGWQLVLVGGDPEDVCRGYWNGVAWTLMSVTHWMPLPPPPREETKR